MQSIVQTQPAPSVETQSEGLTVTSHNTVIDEVTSVEANDNEEASEKEAIPSLYAALGYLPRCPYQWWLD